MRRFLTILLAVCLCLGAVPKAYAANRTSLEWREASRTGSVTLELTDLDGSGIYGVQLEMTLEGKFPDCTFTARDKAAYAPDCTVSVENGKTSVTIYLTSKDALNDGTDLTLGSLDLGTKETVGEETFPDRAYVTILNRDLTGSPPERISVINDSKNSRPSTSSNNTANRPGADDAPDTPAGTNQPVPDSTPSVNISVFSDVKPGDWFSDAVLFVQSCGMMNGTSEDTFAPNATTTRAMIVTILHRLEGSPAAGTLTFSDVPAGEYYAAPVAWAAAYGIVTGYSDSIFAPNNPITREQMAAILYRYAQYKNVDVSGKNDMARFDDTDKISPYAKEALSWAVEAKLITGIDSSLEPAGSATRAQVAAILMRFCTNVLES